MARGKDAVTVCSAIRPHIGTSARRPNALLSMQIGKRSAADADALGWSVEPAIECAGPEVGAVVAVAVCGWVEDFDLLQEVREFCECGLLGIFVLVPASDGG